MMCYLIKIKLKDEEKRMRKKVLVIGATVVLAMASMTGCGSKDSSGGTTSEEATVTDVESTDIKVSEEASSEVKEVTDGFSIEEMDDETMQAYLDKFNASSLRFDIPDEKQGYKEGDEFVCGEYVFNATDYFYPTCKISDNQELTAKVCIDYASEADIDLFEGFDSFDVEANYDDDSVFTLTYVRTGDIVEFTNADGNKVKMYPVERTDSIGDAVTKYVFIAVDNGVSMELISEGIEITQDDFEKFLPLTEGWVFLYY